MIIKTIDDENFNHYKLPSMVIAFPSCTWKCEKECKGVKCQNSALALSHNIDISYKNIVNRYIKNNLTHAFVFAGLEPIDSFNSVLNLVKVIRQYTKDDIVIYTGYYKEEIINKITLLSQYKNIIVKFGRYKIGYEKHYDQVLGIELASDNQYAEKIS